MAKAKSSMNMDENIASALCYVLTWVTGIIFLVLEKENKTVKFHAWQSIFTFIPIMVVGWIFMGPLGISWTSNSVYGYSYPVASFSVFYWIGALIYFMMFLIWLFLMYKAYKGEKYKLPFVGDLAEKQVK